MPLHHGPHGGDFGGVLEFLEPDHLAVHLAGKVAALVEHVGQAAGHARREIAARRPEHDDPAAGHVLAAVVADGLDDRLDAGVAHAETLARHAADVHLARGCAIKGDIADDDVLLRDERRARGRVDDDLAAGQALADVIVGVALEDKGHAVGEERAEALAGRALEVDADGVVGQAGGAPLAGDLAAGDRADDPVDVADGQLGYDLLAPLDGRLAEGKQRREVQRLLQAVVLRNLAEAADLGPDVGLVKDVGEIEPAGLPVVDRLARLQPVRRGRPSPRPCGSRAGP